MFSEYVISTTDGKTKATIIPERGGLVSSIFLPFLSGSREILFLHDYAFNKEINDLPGGLPFLFPICGRLSYKGNEGQYVLNKKRQSLSIHGFSWQEKWFVNSISDNAIEMVLRHNENTLLHYPFHFEVRLRYEVLPGKLLCHQIYKNCESLKKMPYYAGFHPYFLTPAFEKGKEKVRLYFESLYRLAYNETLTDIIGKQAPLSMPACVTNTAINEQLNVLGENKSAGLFFENNEKILIDVCENSALFPYLQLYTIPEKPFFCVEHWMGVPNAMNVKKGLRWLNPGQSETAVYCISSG